MRAPVAVTAGGALTTWAPMLPGYIAAFVALVVKFDMEVGHFCV